MQTKPRKVFGDLHVRKQALLDNRNMDLRKPQNWYFSKELVHDFGQNWVEVFSSLVSYQKWIEKKCLLTFWIEKKPFKRTSVLSPRTAALQENPLPWKCLCKSTFYFIFFFLLYHVSLLSVLFYFIFLFVFKILLIFPKNKFKWKIHYCTN